MLVSYGSYLVGGELLLRRGGVQVGGWANDA